MEIGSAPEAWCDSVAFAVFGVDWEFFKPYIVLGLALGGAYALSGVGIVVLYQATGVLNLAFGAIGAAGALICYWILNHTTWPRLDRVRELHRRSAAVVHFRLRRGARARVRAPRPARQDDGHARARPDPARVHGVAGPGRRGVQPRADAADVEAPLRALRSRRQLDARAHARVRDRAHGRARRSSSGYTKLGTAYRAIATDREITATLGVPVRRVEASAWLGSGLVCGTAGLLLADLYHDARLHGVDVSRHLLARRGPDRAAALA